MDQAMYGSIPTPTTAPVLLHEPSPSNSFSFFSVNEPWMSRWNDRINIETLRPLPVFLGISGNSFCFSAEAFSPPVKHWDKSTLEKIRLRVRLNLAYFLSNYVMIFCGTTIVVTLTHPIMIMWGIILWLLWQIHWVSVQHDISLVFMEIDLGKYLTVERRETVLYALTASVVVFYCLVPILTVILVSSLMILTHAVMRDPKHIDQQGSSKALRHVIGRGSDHESDEDTDSSEVMIDKADLA